MAQSLAKRLDGRKQEIIEYTRIWGREKAFRRYYEEGLVRDPLAWRKFLEEETGEEDFGLHPVIGLGNGGINFEDFLETIVNTVQRLRNQIAEQDKVIKSQNNQIEYLKAQSATRIEAKMGEVMAVCRGSPAKLVAITEEMDK